MLRVASSGLRRALRAPVVARPAVAVRFQSGEAEEAVRTHSEDEVLLNFALPHTSLVANKAVKRVTVPGRGGTYGIQAKSPPMLSELKPGVVLVDYGSDELERFVISGGFAFTHADGRVEVSAPEGVRIEDVDADQVRIQADALRQAADAAADGSPEEAEALVGLEVCRAIGYELDMKL